MVLIATLLLALSALSFVVWQAAHHALGLVELALGLFVLPFALLPLRSRAWQTPVVMAADRRGMHFLGGDELTFVPWSETGPFSIERIQAVGGGTHQSVIATIGADSAFWQPAARSPFREWLLGEVTPDGYRRIALGPYGASPQDTKDSLEALRRGRSLAVALLALLLTACGSDSTAPAPEAVDLDRLFAAATSSEVAQIRAEWATRSTAATGLQVDSTAPFNIGAVPGTLRVVSHLVDGLRHYGAVVAPNGAAAGSRPVLVYAHGGDQGVNVDELGLLFLALGAEAAEYVWVVPSFRSEPLRVGGQVFRSEGPPSPWDRDVDDALALLSEVLANEPAADPSRVAVLGLSRGAGVGLLMGVRDPRIDGVVAFFGPTDFFDPWSREIVTEALAGRPSSLPGVQWLDQQFIQPLRNGSGSAEQLRRELIRRSAVLFASSLPAVQLQHGTVDAIVPFSQAERLDVVMRGLGRSAPDYEFFAYPGAGHTPLQMTGSTARAATFLQRVLGRD
jgi:acetyl esterase/lipase